LFHQLLFQVDSWGRVGAVLGRLNLPRQSAEKALVHLGDGFAALGFKLRLLAKRDVGVNVTLGGGQGL